MHLRLWAGSITNVQDHIRQSGLLQSGMEGLHQMMGQSAHQPLTVSISITLPRGSRRGPGRGINVAKSLFSARTPAWVEKIHQSAFSCIGISYQGHSDNAVLFPAGVLLLPVLFHSIQLFFQSLYSSADMPPVRFQFRFAGASYANAAS